MPRITKREWGYVLIGAIFFLIAVVLGAAYPPVNIGSDYLK